MRGHIGRLKTRIEQWRNRPSSFAQAERGLALMKKFTRRSTTVAVTTVALVGTGIAFAAWTSTGSGTGSATAGTDAGLTVSAASVSGLYPNQATTQNVTISNPNPYMVKLSTLVLDSVTTATPGCSVSITDIHGNNPGNSKDVSALASLAASSGSTVVAFPVKVENSLPNGCQGATFTLTYTASGASSAS